MHRSTEIKGPTAERSVDRPGHGADVFETTPPSGPALPLVPASINTTVRTQLQRLISRPPEASRKATPAIRLGAFEVWPKARALLRNGVRTEIGGRAFDLLMVLLKANGEIVPKNDIIREVWPSTTVVESNLKVQLSALRRALGCEAWRVKTVSGRGYFLIADEASRTSPATQLRTPAEPAPSPQPLVILVDADFDTQQFMMQTIEIIASQLHGLARLSLVPLGG